MRSSDILILCKNCKSKIKKPKSNKKFCSKSCSNKFGYEKNKNRRKQQIKNYYEKNKNKLNKERKEKHKENKDRDNKLVREWAGKNKDWRKEYMKNYRDKNIEKLRAYRKNWRKNNPIKVKCQKYANDYLRKEILNERKVCEICQGKKNLCLHHLKYTNDKKDILLVCSSCHGKIHSGLLIFYRENKNKTNNKTIVKQTK